MKLALIKYAPPLISKEAYWNFVLENEQDLDNYIKLSSEISASQFFEVWTSMKKGYDFNHANAFNNQGTCYLASMEVWNKASGSEVSILEACSIHDQLLYKKYLVMQKLIKTNRIKIAPQGGYCPLDSMFEIVEEKIADEKDLREFLVTPERKINDKIELKIDKPMVVIENDSLVSNELFKLLPQKYCQLMNFKFRTQNWGAQDFYKLFDEAVKNDLTTVYAETSLYDKKQFEGLRNVLNQVMINNPDKKLEVKILSSSAGADFLNMQKILIQI